jgi:hypothetical protein
MMKKLFILFVVAGFFASCDNAAENGQTTKDSLDSVENAKKEMIDSSATEAKDSIEQRIDAKKEMVDSLNLSRDTTNN